MKKSHSILFLLILAVCAWTATPFSSCLGAEGGKIAVGSTIPVFKLGAPDGEQAQNYLGLKAPEPFSISQLPSRLVLIEAVGAL